MFEEKLTTALLDGIRSIRSAPSCAIVDKIQYVKDKCSWAIPISISSRQESKFMPRESFWHMVVSKNYPYGSVDVHPSKKGGIESTFHHQEFNTNSKYAFRTGKICLTSPRANSFITDQLDPVGNSEKRLKWYVIRVFEWVKAATSGKLTKNGDPFELPRIVCESEKGITAIRLVHDESPHSYHLWGGHVFGHLVLTKSDILNNTLLVYKFNTLNSIIIRRWDGRANSGRKQSKYKGFWWLWPDPIINRPWHAPHTWGELRDAGRTQGIDVDDILKRIVSLSKKSKNAQVILFLGYPIPKKFGERAVEIFWQAIYLPLSKGAQPKGYRNNMGGYRRSVFRGNSKIKYLKTFNWHPDRLQSRGRLNSSLREKRIAIIGLGALGSCLAELLVRMGATSLLLLDFDFVESGNIARHQATLSDIGKPKVHVIKEKLAKISPQIKVDTNTSSMPSNESEIKGTFQNYDILVDCTSSDQVIKSLSIPFWSEPKYIATFSLGYEAKKLYSYITCAKRFSSVYFFEQIARFVDEDKEKLSKNDEIFEGVGCWHPIFPARYDNINFAAIKCVKILESLCEVKEEISLVEVFGYYEDETYTGYKRLN